MRDPESFYDATAEDEWTRLDDGLDGRLEFEFTTDELEGVLPDVGHVVDVGGGAGRYAVRLARDGHDVTLVDLSTEQLRLAARKREEHGVPARVAPVRGRADRLPLDADVADATLCLGGVLSHLLEEDDRRAAAAELRRVTAADGPVVVSVMGLLGFVQLKLLTGHNVRALPALLETGDYDGSLLARYDYDDPFTETHFFRRAELVSLLESAGLSVERVTALEGLGSPFHDGRLESRVADLAEADREAVVATLDALRDDPAVADLSVHLLAVCRA